MVDRAFRATTDLRRLLVYRRDTVVRYKINATGDSPHRFAAIFEYIEGWFNPRHRHSYCHMHSPIDYEAQHTNAAAAAYHHNQPLRKSGGRSTAS